MSDNNVRFQAYIDGEPVGELQDLRRETRIAIFADQEQLFEGIVKDFKAQGIDVDVVRRDDPIVVGAGPRYRSSLEAVRLGFEGGKTVLLDEMALPVLPDLSVIDRLLKPRDRSVKATTYVEPPLTHHDLERIAAAKAKRARKAAKLRKENKQ
jgi:hypothetical protein